MKQFRRKDRLAAAPLPESWGQKLYGIFPPFEGEKYAMELEMEASFNGAIFPRVYGWRLDQDGSLRGNSAEYVFRAPVNPEYVADKLDALFEELDAANMDLLESHRTSTHVHVNVSDKTPVQIMTIVCLYAVVEELLTLFVTPERRSNAFCLRFCDSHDIVDYLAAHLRSPIPSRLLQISETSSRYTSLNLRALNKFGSLEFRLMQGAQTAHEAHSWFKLIQEIVEASSSFTNPADIISRFSGYGPQGFVEIFLPGLYEACRQNFNETAVIAGMRIAQEIAYACPNWQVQQPEETTDENQSTTAMEREQTVTGSGETVSDDGVASTSEGQPVSASTFSGELGDISSSTFGGNHDLESTRCYALSNEQIADLLATFSRTSEDPEILD